jgi:hypothetical protein
LVPGTKTSETKVEQSNLHYPKMKATTFAIVAALLVACAISGAAAISACETARYLRNAGVPEVRFLK